MVREDRTTYWQRLVQAQAESGPSAAAFCKDHPTPKGFTSGVNGSRVNRRPVKEGAHSLSLYGPQRSRQGTFAFVSTRRFRLSWSVILIPAPFAMPLMRFVDKGHSGAESRHPYLSVPAFV
jgi:hypothetical protein